MNKNCKNTAIFVKNPRRRHNAKTHKIVTHKIVKTTAIHSSTVGVIIQIIYTIFIYDQSKNQTWSRCFFIIWFDEKL